jgi:hypothetical protein
LASYVDIPYKCPGNEEIADFCGKPLAFTDSWREQPLALEIDFHRGASGIHLNPADALDHLLAKRGFPDRNGVRAPVGVSIIPRVADLQTKIPADFQEPVMNDNVFYRA